MKDSKSLTKKVEIVNLIEKFKNIIYDAYNVNLIVVIPQNINFLMFPLIDLEQIIVQSLHEFNNDFKYIESFKSRTRKKDFIAFKTAFCAIAKEYGYGSSAIGRFLHNDHASVINLNNRADDFMDTKDPYYLKIYNNLKEKINIYVATISNTFESGDNSQPMHDIILNKTEALSSVY